MVWISEKDSSFQRPLIEILDDGVSAALGDYLRSVKMLNELLPDDEEG